MIEKTAFDRIIITGDIAEAHSFARHLYNLYDRVKVPIYFVLGNHDFYKGSIADSIKQAMEINNYPIDIHYLGYDTVVKLTSKTCLIGANGWGDCRSGTVDLSRFDVNDHNRISDFLGMMPNQIIGLRQRLAEEEADRLKKTLWSACAFDHIIIATHVPPIHAKQRNNATEYSYPFYCNAALGAELTTVTVHKDNSNKRFTVLCGHTHVGDYVEKYNMEFHISGSNYNNPKLEVIEVK